MKYRTIFTVSGRGEFPFDMLRYDVCRPYDEPSSNLMRSRHNEDLNRVITLVKDHEQKVCSLTARRWESFGWKVSEIITTKAY